MRRRPLQEQVVVVMGASSGVGREAALRMARRGARLVVSARGEESLRSLVEQIRGEGGHAIAVPCDVAEFEQVERVADRAIEAFGRIDTWAHIAAVALWARLEETSPGEWFRVIDVNLNGAAYGAMVALPHLRRSGGGALIYVSSVEADAPVPLQSAYAASKHGLRALVKALRMELEAEGAPITVTEIKPYGISTPLFDNARSKIGVKPQPIPPIYHPVHAARAIVYVAEHPVPELTVGGFGRASVLCERIAPWLADSFLRRIAPWLQRTDEPKPLESPDNLFESLNDTRVEGSLTPKARRTSLYTWLSLHPAARWGLAATLLGAALFARRTSAPAAVPAEEALSETPPEEVYAVSPT